MLVGNQLIFVHHPRTGGTSVRNYLTRCVPDNYYPMNDPSLSRDDKVGLMHQNLVMCYRYARKIGLDPQQIPTLVCIRNPYSLMLSEYLYLKQKWGKKIKDLEKTFSAYLANMELKVSAQKKQKWTQGKHGRFEDFICINGITPRNVTIARYESLETDLNQFMQSHFAVDEKIKLPHKNASRHGDIANYYTEKDEARVYALWQNAFESGLYTRYDGL